jgi:flagellar motility protein MotE (MotC chaperone)
MSTAPPDDSSLADVPRVPVSWGELIDKLTILEIKSERLTSAEAIGNVRLELRLLAEAAASRLAAQPRLQELKSDLRSVNEALWDIENEIRHKESLLQFDEGFVTLARSVYKQNDRRASIKRAINEQAGSVIVEEKSYHAYRS